jgi:flagellar hook-basal body complex protein FliE
MSKLHNKFLDIHSQDYLINNPYNLLGLDINNKNKEVLRRASDLSKLMSIQGNTDFCSTLFKLLSQQSKNFYEKEVYLKITDPEQKIPFQFFWFLHPDSTQKDIIFSKKDSKPEYILFSLFKNYVLNEDIFALKSAVIYANIFGIITNDTQPIILSIHEWEKIINSELIWSKHNEIYQNSNDLEQKNDNFSLFRKNILTFLADYYFQIFQHFEDASILMKFYEVYKIHSVKTEKLLLFPLIQEITEVYDKLETFKTSFSTLEKSQKTMAKLDEYLAKLDEIIKKVKDLYFGDHLEVKDISEKVSLRLRSKAIDIINEVKDEPVYSSYGVKLLNEALRYTDSAVTKNRIQKDLEEIEYQKKSKEIVEQIKEDFKVHRYEASRRRIEELKLLDESSDKQDLVRILLNASYKNEANYRFNLAMDKANSIAKSATGDIHGVLSQLKKAEAQLELLYSIAEKEGDLKESMNLLVAKTDLSIQITTLSIRSLGL